MNGIDWGVLIAASTLALTVLIAAVRLGADRQSIKTEMIYLRRDLDQLLRLYHLVPVKEQEERRRR